MAVHILRDTGDESLVSAEAEPSPDESRVYKCRSTKLVSTLPFANRLWEIMSRQTGIVVLIGSMTNSLRALLIVVIASALLA